GLAEGGAGLLGGGGAAAGHAVLGHGGYSLTGVTGPTGLNPRARSMRGLFVLGLPGPVAPSDHGTGQRSGGRSDAGGQLDVRDDVADDRDRLARDQLVVGLRRHLVLRAEADRVDVDDLPRGRL